FNDIQFRTASEGWIVGNNNAFIKSTDSGDTWTLVSEKAIPTKGLMAFDEDTVYLNGRHCLLKSLNGGDTFTCLPYSTTSEIRNISLTDQNTGWAVVPLSTV